MNHPMRFVVLGLSITSSWGNGHATTYRCLLRELAARGHSVLFLERDKPWYAAQRDCTSLKSVEIALYQSLSDLQERFADAIRKADVVILGSYVPEGVAVGKWVTDTAEGLTAFYDIDTPVTLAKLKRKDTEYLSAELIPAFDLYLSFTGGPTLHMLEEQYGAAMARPLYCSFDPSMYYPQESNVRWDLGYLGTYSDDRQSTLDRLLIQAACEWRYGRFVVAGSQYPDSIVWPANVAHLDHVPPGAHRDFYNSQRFTLNVTRKDMIQAGFSPSVRLFEAAACAVPVISDYWEGMETFFIPKQEILIARSADDTLRYLQEMTEEEREAIGLAARERVLASHTAAHRAQELESYVIEAMQSHQAAAR